MRTFLFSTLLAAVVFFGASGRLDDTLDPAFMIGPKSAQALDFFGSDEGDENGESAEPASREAFWRSDSGIPESQPIGIPTSFADLAERVAPAVVSIQTRGTVSMSQPGLPPGLEEFFGGYTASFHGAGPPNPDAGGGQCAPFPI